MISGFYEGPLIIDNYVGLGHWENVIVAFIKGPNVTRHGGRVYDVAKIPRLRFAATGIEPLCQWKTLPKIIE